MLPSQTVRSSRRNTLINMLATTRLSCLCFILMISSCCSKSVCRRSDVDFNKCVADKMNSLKPTLKKGLPLLKIGSLDPMFVPKIRLRQGNGPVSIDLTSTDQIFKGILNYDITSAKIDLENYKMEFTVKLPWLHVGGKTKMEGRILAFPINGEGESWSNYTMVSGKAVLKGHPIKKESKEYFSLDNVKFDMSVKRARVHMDDLFNGNKELGTAMNNLMSDNWEVIFQELKPVIDQTVEELIKDIATKVFKHYSLEELFPQ